MSRPSFFALVSSDADILVTLKFKQCNFIINRFKIIEKILTNMEIKWKRTFPKKH
ncbi:Serpentine type 7TM GPCR chemoreceptor [Francisella orientalis str. Toba 04]|nr:Serpentine type 7TM GPCR chemoreceptor [Francisella orientalis str. Toba 04]